MSLTVREALEMNVFKNAKLVSGKSGLNNEITWVNILEILDDLNHLQAGEFLITTAYGLNEKDSAFIKKISTILSQKRLSAIAIQTGYYIKNIPEAFKVLSKKQGLPLIELPHDASFSDITKAILEKLTSQKSALFEFSEKINNELTNVLLMQQGLQGIARVINSLTNHPVRIFNNWFQPVAYSGVTFSSDKIQKEFLALKKSGIIETLQHISTPYEIKNMEEQNVPHQLITPIRSKGDIYGYISMLKNGKKISQEDVFALNKASSLCALELTKKDHELKSKIRLLSDFIEKIIRENPNEEYIKQNSSFFDFPAHNHCCCLVVEVNGKNDFHYLYRIANLIDMTLKSKKRKTMSAVYLNKIITIISVKEEGEMDKVVALTKQTRDELKKYFTNLKIEFALGDLCSGLHQLKRSYKQAVKVLDFNKKNNEYSTLYYKNLGIFRLIMEIETGVLREFYKDTLLPIINYDKTHSLDLVKTLQVFLANNNLKKTAEILFLHRHTVRYRLNKIKKLTNLNPFNPDDQKILYIALLISKFINHED